MVQGQLLFWGRAGGAVGVSQPDHTTQCSWGHSSFKGNKINCTYLAFKSLVCGHRVEIGAADPGSG